ncbi:Flp pilus assembly protein CpaB [Janthinobacterium sp. CG_23.3]
MLFRAQALSHSQQDPTEGSILLRSPRILWGCCGAALLAAAGIALLLSSAHYTPQLRVGGRLLADAAAPHGTTPTAQLLVPASALPLLRRGQRIALRYPALPADAGRHGYASISSVSRAPQPQADAGAQPRFSVLLAPETLALQEPLQAGMAIESNIALPQVRLIDWIIHAKPAQQEQR